MPQNIPQMKLIPDSAVYQREQEEAKKAEESVLSQQITSDLALYIRKCWNKARDAKEQKINAILLDCKRRRESEYPPDKKAKYQQVGSDVFMSITDMKCGAAESWINDTVNQNGTRAWSIDPTPVPELSPELETEISQRITQKVMQVVDQYAAMATQQGIRMEGYTQTAPGRETS